MRFGRERHDVDLIVDGMRFTLSPDVEVALTDRLRVPFSSALTLLPGSHTLVAQWFLDGTLIQTVNLAVVIG